ATPSNLSAFSPDHPPPTTSFRPDRRQARTTTLTRRYEIAYLSAGGSVEMETRLAPEVAAFEEAFSAFARGTVIATTAGAVAVEDLVPGMKVLTSEGAEHTITWIGSMTLYPAQSVPRAETATLTRITADAFGHGRPMPDVVLGPRARLLIRDGRCRNVVGGDTALAPVRSFVDGVSIIEVTPAAPVTVFNLVLDRHAAVRAAGLEVESYHPANAFAQGGDPQL